GATMGPSSEPAAPAPRPRARNALAQVLGAEEGGEGGAREGGGRPERPADEQGRAEQQGRRPEGQGQKRKRLSPRWRMAVIAGALAVIAGALAWWLHARRFENTDDAQIDGDITAVSPRVAGTVVAVRVHDNQRVRAGDLLAELDPADLRVALARARAAALQSEAGARLAQLERRRAQELLRGRAIPRGTFDQRASAAEQAQA